MKTVTGYRSDYAVREYSRSDASKKKLSGTYFQCLASTTLIIIVSTTLKTTNISAALSKPSTSASPDIQETRNDNFSDDDYELVKAAVVHETKMEAGKQLLANAHFDNCSNFHINIHM